MKAISATENTLISVEAALEAILEKMRPVETETAPLARSFGRVLAEAVISEVNVPPFANSAMDGYALIARNSQGASLATPVRLQVVEYVPAGVTPTQQIVAGAAARIMTGAPLPGGADAVIRFEETSEYIAGEELADHEVLIYQPVQAGDNVRLAGEDIKIGQTLLEAGHRLRPQDIGVLAAVGRPKVQVYRRPRVAILATGDELVAVDESIGPGQIRNSNEYVQAALVEKYGGEAVMLGIARDTVQDLTTKIRQGLAQQVDLFLTSAGVSIGDFDMVKTVLAEEGEMQFWQVGIKPGKPLAFGWLRSVGPEAPPLDRSVRHHHQAEQPLRQIPLIGLPGNPVAAMVAFEVFARPAILKLAGRSGWQRRTFKARLDEPVSNNGRRHYMRAFAYGEAEEYRVTTRDSSVQVQGSGILTSLVWANCLVIVPEGETHLAKDALVNIWLLD